VDEAATVRREITIAAAPDVVARFFTEAAKVIQWMASRAEVDARPQGRLRLEFDRPDGSTDVALGEFIEVSPRRIVFTWGFEGGVNLPPRASRVEITLTPEPGGTRVRLVHRELPPKQREAHSKGWAMFLDRLVGAVRAAAAPGQHRGGTGRALEP
jgi:uncharacterized protein YndB with AHSA1/START domain